MKRNSKKTFRNSMFALLTLVLTGALVLTGGALVGGHNVLAEAGAAVSAPQEDPSPAIYVYQKNNSSVVGIITSADSWNRSTREVEHQAVAQGSGVVIAEGGYVLTNYHVIEGGDSYQVLLSNGDKVDAEIAGTDSATDLAVLKVTDETAAASLTPVDVASTDSLAVGSTVIAIGNPGGEVLANTVTMGIVSALERTSVTGGNTSRRISYIQHDAAISSGNSGGGLFNINGELVGINTLKYGGSVFSSGSYEGLGFAIPSETVQKVAHDLIENGTVTRPGLGISVQNVEGPDEPLKNTPPASVMIAAMNPDSAAEKAGLQLYDFITEVDGERITSYLDLTSLLDQHEPGDTISVTVVRYAQQSASRRDSYDYGYGNGNNYGNGYGFGYGFGDWFFGRGYDQMPYGSQNPDEDPQQDDDGQTQNAQPTIGGDFQTLTFEVTLQALDAAK